MIALIVSYIFLLSPLITASWGWNMIAKGSQADVQAYNKKLFAHINSDFWSSMGKLGAYFSWGGTPVRALFSAGAFLLGLAAIFRFQKKEACYRLIPLFILANILLVWFGRYASGHHFSPRYLFAAFPAHLLVLGLGLYHAGETLRLKPRPALALRWSLCIAAALLFLYPRLPDPSMARLL